MHHSTRATLAGFLRTWRSREFALICLASLATPGQAHERDTASARLVIRGVHCRRMKFQCETGLRWLRQSRIQGIIFLGNTTLDLGFESVDWTREWIRNIGDDEL